MAVLVLVDIVVLLIVTLVDATRLKTETRLLQRQVAYILITDSYILQLCIHTIALTQRQQMKLHMSIS